MSDFIDDFVPGLFVFMILLIIVGVPVYAIKEASVGARLYNQQHGTSYTTSDFFWAKDQINTQTQTITLREAK